MASSEEDFRNEKRQPPELVKIVFKNVLHDSHHTEINVVEDYVLSYSQDLVHGLSRGKCLTAEHTLMANVLHGLTGQKPAI